MEKQYEDPGGGGVGGGGGCLGNAKSSCEELYTNREKLNAPRSFICKVYESAEIA